MTPTEPPPDQDPDTADPAELEGMGPDPSDSESTGEEESG